MKRILYFVLLVLTPALANAFGLGKLDLNSALNEPFDARIQLLSPTADELDSLKITLADSEAFARAKIDRPFILSKLRFDLRRSVDDGPDYIRVYTQDPIREPFLNFLVEVSWSNGRLFREYTVLLDPPLYDPNARSAQFAKTADISSSLTESPVEEAVTIDDPDHQVTYGEAYEKFANKDSKPSASPSYTPAVNYSGGDYGPTTGADTLWSIASEMRPDSSVSVNKMMMALLRANPDAFINQNINGLKRGQILRMPNESEMNALSNAEALSEAQSQYSAWGDIRDNLSSAVNERPEVSSAIEAEAVTESQETVTEEATADAELKLVSADDSDEATEQVSSVDSGTGEELVLAQETIQVLTQENIELKDRVQESDALLADLKRLLSLKDDELAALQEQMAAAEAEEVMAKAVEEVVEAEEEVMAEEVIEAEEEVMAEVAEEEVVEAEEEIMDEAEEEVSEAEEEVLEIVEAKPEPASGGVMAMVDQYLGPIKDLLLGNPMIGMAVAGILVLLIIIVVIMKFRKEPAETVHIDAMTEEAFPDFDSGDLGNTGEDVPDSEAATVLPDTGSEAETELPDDGTAEFDLDLDEEEEKTQFIAAEDTPAIEEPEEEEEDPLQEVNTYLAFEQFDQAEEFVRNVINDNPENPEYHTKLLEVFYTSGNKKSYEEEAKVLDGIVGGEGEYWNMATAMWQEMSPNRALFEAGDDDDDDEADNTSGGFVDVTADDEAGDDGGDLDFDIGGGEESPAAEEAPVAEEEMLDITGSSGEEMLDITSSSEAEDLLDVTAAVNMEEAFDTESETAPSSSSDDILDISGTGGSDLLELTSSDEASGEDLLDVTAAANLDLDSEEDLLDVTAATGAGADSSELLDLDASESELDFDIESAVDSEAEEDSNDIEFNIPAEDNATVEFDLDTGEAESSDENADDDNALDFDMSMDDGKEIELEDSSDESEPELEIAGNEIELDISADDAGLEVDLGSIDEDEEPIRLDVEDSEDEISLDMDLGEGSDVTSDDDISLELDMSDSDSKDEISLDMGDDDSGFELDLSIAEDQPEAKAEPEDTSSDVPEIDFDFSLDDDASEEEVSLDLDGTVELPKSALSVTTDDDDDDDDDHTVFVPRAAQPEEQSAEDEIATKLDLAKAYVELGDKDSAKTILDEVMGEGNDEQRKQAEDLLGQI
jgi:pilus assembly protein FimV